MSKTRKYTDQDFINAVASSNSIRQVLDMLHLKPAGGNYTSCRKLIKELSLDTSHFQRIWNKGRIIGPKLPIEEYLTKTSTIQSYKLKNRLLSEGILTSMCRMCQNVTWLNQAIPLELDHIDGDNTNNTLSNLRLLCPNCHALTPTYRGKNIGRATRIRTEI